MKHRQYMKLCTSLLIIITVLAIVIHNNVQRSVDVLSFPSLLLSDAQNPGGLSHIELLHDESPLIFECELVNAYQWPYCEYQLQVATDKKGLDLSRYDNIAVRARVYHNDRAHRSTQLRLHFKHLEPEVYTRAGYKANYLEYHANQHRNVIDIPLSKLQVAEWWRRDLGIGIQYGHTDISNTQSISIVSPANAEPGLYRFEVDQFEVSGPLVDSQLLYLVLLVAWLIAAGLYLSLEIVEIFIRNRQLKSENVRLIQSNQEYIVKASYDGLTGALNRSGSEDVIQSIMTSNENTIVMYMDLDHFKQLNDTYGHQCGDSVLQVFSQCVRHVKGARQHLVRWGGEEFLLVCEAISLDESRKIAQDIQHQLAIYNWPFKSAVTCSIGIAQVSKPHLFYQALEQADHALYRAKNMGRNRIEVNI